MGFISTILTSSVLMMVVAFVCAVFCIRCLIYGVMGGTSMLLRVAATILFALLAYYFWHHAMAMHGPNLIDDAAYEAWHMIRVYLAKIKHMF